jgi:hypothetical protein
MSPTSTDSTSVSGFKIEKWQNACPFTVLEAHTQANGGHTTPIDANAVISFFGLDKSEPDPQVAACGGSGVTAGSSGGTAGGSGAPAAGSGGATAAGGGGAMAGGRAGAPAAGSGSGKAGAGAMAGGNGGRASTGMFGAAGMALPGTAGQVAIGVAGSVGIAGMTGNLGAGAPAIGSAAGPLANKNDAGGCGVAAGRDTSSATGVLIGTAFVITLGRRRRRKDR